MTVAFWTAIGFLAGLVIGCSLGILEGFRVGREQGKAEGYRKGWMAYLGNGVCGDGRGQG